MDGEKPGKNRKVKKVYFRKNYKLPNYKTTDYLKNGKKTQSANYINYTNYINKKINICK